jgi:hypothetical protein
MISCLSLLQAFSYSNACIKNRNNLYFCALSEARKPENEDVFMQEDEEPKASDEEIKDEAGGWTEVKDVSADEDLPNEDKEEIVPDETIHEVAVGKGLSGALKLLQERGTLKESIDWGGRNMDKKKSKLVGIVDADEPKETRSTSLVDHKKEIRIDRLDEFGRIVSASLNQPVTSYFSLALIASLFSPPNTHTHTRLLHVS